MSSYQLYYLRDGMLLGSDAIEAADDSEATRIAKQRGTGNAVEVWHDHVRVRVVAPSPSVAARASRPGAA